MKTNYLRNKTYPHIGFKIVVGAFVALVLLFIAYGDVLERAISNSVFGFLKPMFGVASSVKNATENVGFALADKGRLQKENDDLREVVDNLKGNIENLEMLRKENEDFKIILGRQPDRKILANIILAPPETMYDTFLVDVGWSEGVEVGMNVITPGYIFLGHVTEVFEHESRLGLISNFGQETNVYLEGSGMPVILSGRGAEMMSISLPKDAPVTVGERIFTISRTPHLVGFVEKVEQKSSDFFQTLISRTPLNIWHLRSVLIIK
ncbi:MAG: rod shape-determining protein MreC [Patescibacteria group bacterium]